MCVYWYTGLSLACFLENIRVIYVVGESILPKNVCLARNDLVFSAEFEKIALQKQQHKIAPFSTHKCVIMY